MITFYFIRHGKTEWNAEGRLQGHLNSNLIEKGKEDTIRLANRLKEIPFHQVYSSPSGRARHTAEILMKERENTSLLTTDLLKEIHLGKWQGKTIAEIQQEDGENYYHYKTAPHLYKATLNGTEAEQFQDVLARLQTFLRNVQAEVTAGNVLVVTHGVVIQLLIMLCRNLPLANLWQSKAVLGTSITTVQMENNTYKLVTEADTSHLE